MESQFAEISLSFLSEELSSLAEEYLSNSSASIDSSYE